LKKHVRSLRRSFKSQIVRVPLFYLNIAFNDRRFSALLVADQQAFDLAQNTLVSRFYYLAKSRANKRNRFTAGNWCHIMM